MYVRAISSAAAIRLLVRKKTGNLSPPTHGECALRLTKPNGNISWAFSSRPIGLSQDPTAPLLDWDCSALRCSTEFTSWAFLVGEKACRAAPSPTNRWEKPQQKSIVYP